MKNIKINIIILIIILIFLKLLVGKTYYPIYSGIPIYPCNYTEVEDVKNYIKKRNKLDEIFFYKTNDSVVPAFIDIVDETPDTLYKIIHSISGYIYFFKYIINRARPYDIDLTITPLSTKTSQTPAYPAGHAMQAYFLAKILSKKYPNKKHILDSIAYNCDLTRVKAGIHYPSDGKFSKFLVDTIFL